MKTSHPTRKRTLMALAGTVSMLSASTFVAPAEASRGPKGQETTFVVTIQNVSDHHEFSQSGLFAHPDGGSEPGPALPGSSYSFDFYANAGDRLSLATMLVQTNDWFISPLEGGIELYGADGTPNSGEVTDQFYVLDVGTEVDQETGLGADQPLRQSGPDTGAEDPDPTVRQVETAPAIEELVSVALVSGDGGLFTLTINNVSGESSLPGPLAPGVFVVHPDGAPLFGIGEADRGEGLEALAEDGAAAGLAGNIAARTGVATPITPGVYAASHRWNLLFRDNRPDRGKGLESLAEDGDPSEFAAYLDRRTSGAGRNGGDNGVFAIPAGAEAPGPLLPGESYEFTVTVKPGQRLHVASMMVESNDWFFTTKSRGLKMFRRGEPLVGDVTSGFRLYDAGTEVDQAPGFGPDQPLRQDGPNTGAADENPNVRQIGSDVSNSIRVTIEPLAQS